MKILQGNNIDLLALMPDNSVDSIVTDPPYGLKFMGKKWDHDVPSVELWQECLRVLKPGGHLLSFGGSRTYHRMAVAIEDAGFEIRDQIMWVYGSGFPKSHNIGKAVDKIQGNEREITGQDQSGSKRNCMAGDFEGGKYNLTKGNSTWEGWGTALKPAHEPIVLARKPLSESTIAKNVLKWGTGGLNIDGCRVGTEGGGQNGSNGSKDRTKWRMSAVKKSDEPIGRFPANFIHDGIDTEWSRYFYCAKTSKKERNAGLEGFEEKESGVKNDSGRGFSETDPYKKIMRQNHHPTVKPIKLMSYLCRLITPQNGTVLDPFMGSGSTGIAAKQEGFDFVGMELDGEYHKIAKARINSVV